LWIVFFLAARQQNATATIARCFATATTSVLCVSHIMPPLPWPVDCSSFFTQEHASCCSRALPGWFYILFLWQGIRCHCYHGCCEESFFLNTTATVAGWLFFFFAPRSMWVVAASWLYLLFLWYSNRPPLPWPLLHIATRLIVLFFISWKATAAMAQFLLLPVEWNLLHEPPGRLHFWARQQKGTSTMAKLIGVFTQKHTLIVFCSSGKGTECHNCCSHMPCKYFCIQHATGCMPFHFIFTLLVIQFNAYHAEGN